MTKYESMPWIRRGVKSALDCLYPPHCLICGVLHTTSLCARCAEQLNRITNPCVLCGAAIGSDNGSQSPCGRCQQFPPAYDQVIAPYVYESPLANMVHKLKYHGNTALGHSLGEILAQDIAERVNPLPDLLIPVPLHWSRLMRRGFNQSLELCRHVSRALEIPLERNTAYRWRRTRAQTSLSPLERRVNVRDCFKLRRALSAKSVAIVDDVITTGETVHNLALCLKRGGVCGVQVWALMRTNN